jgi:uncharacterized protein
MRKIFLIIIFFVITGYGIYYSLTRIQFTENITGILPVNKENKFLIELLDSAGIFDRIIFNLSLNDSVVSDPDMLVSVADDLTDSISRKFIPEYILKIEGKSDPFAQLKILEAFYKYLPLYLEEQDYKRIDTLISTGDFDTMFKEYLKVLNTPAGAITGRFIFRDPLSLVPRQLNRLRDLQVDNNLIFYRNYLFTSDKKHLLFFLTPVDAGNTGKNTLFIKQLDKAIEISGKVFDNKVKTEYIGSVPISVANAQQIKKDILLTASIAVILIILLNYYFFRKKRNLWLILVPSYFGAVMALVFFAITKQKVSLIALGIGSVILGLSIDYALHILTHLKHNKSIRESAKSVGAPLLICSVTTVVAFLCLLMLSSPAIRQFALFSVVSVLSAALISILFIPFVVFQDKKNISVQKINFIEKIAAIQTEFHGFRILSILMVTLVLFFFSRKATFEKDIEKSNFMPKNLKIASENLDKVTGLNLKKIYLMSSGNGVDSALMKAEENNQVLLNLKDNHKIDKYNGIQSIIFSTRKQKEKLEDWNQFWTAERKALLKKKLDQASTNNHFKKGAFDKFYQVLDAKYKAVDPDSLFEVFSQIAGNFKIKLSDQVLIASVIRVDNPDQKTSITKAFTAIKGAYVLDRKDFFLRIFDSIKIDFNRLIGFSAIFGMLIILAFFGRIEIAVITFLPIFISWVWTLGLLGLTGIRLNFFNIVICNLIFGLGIDYSTFITKGLIQKYTLGNDDLESHKSSILLSLLTTLVGLGVLILAKHPALRSIAILSIIGLLSSVFVSFVIQPTLFKILTERKKKKRQVPVQMINLIFSILIFSTFGISSLIILILSPVFYILPFSRKKKSFIMRWLSSKVCWFLIREYPYKIKNKRIGFTGQDFDQPSIIISNHQSMIDILIFLSLSPNILILTKDWVWKNPVFGFIVRFSGHINVSVGYENVIENIKERVSEGCSILVFAEGSRTKDGEINRFHKGGFYLAQELKLPVKMILVHGIMEVLPRTGFMLSPGCLTVKILGSFYISDIDPRAYYTASKETCKRMRNAYHELRQEMETPKYLSNRLLANYVYKGPVVENYMKIKLRLEKYYELYDHLIPGKAFITDIGCGYGPITFMLAMRSKERKILAIDYDDEKITLAQNCELATNLPVSFVAADATEYNFNESDVFLISDMLHYLPMEKQSVLIKKCIDKLKYSGSIIIRDGDNLMERKHRGTRLSEFLSTRIGFNKVNSRLSFFASNFVKEVAEKYGMNIEIIDNSKLTSNLIYVLTRKQNEQ